MRCLILIFNQDMGTCDCVDGQQVCQGVSQAVEGLLQVLPGRPTLDWIVSTHQEYIEKRYARCQAKSRISESHNTWTH